MIRIYFVLICLSFTVFSCQEEKKATIREKPVEVVKAPVESNTSDLTAEQMTIATEIIKSFKKNEGEADPQRLFSQHCAQCHGVDGRSGVDGAGDLSRSGLNLEQRVATIYFEHGNAPSFQDKMTTYEMVELALHVALLRQL